MIFFFNLRSPRKHPQNCQGFGRGHEDFGGRSRLLARAAGRGGSKRGHDHRPAQRGRQGRSHQPRSSEPRGSGDADQRSQGRGLGPVGLDAVDEGCFRKEHSRSGHAPTQGFGQGN